MSSWCVTHQTDECRNGIHYNQRRACFYQDEEVPCTRMSSSLVEKEHDIWDKYDHRNHKVMVVNR